MSITETLTKIPKTLFKRISRSSNAQTTSSGGVHSNDSKYQPYLSLLDRNDNRVSYTKGKRLLRDTQIGTGYDILKYLLSSKKWILTNTEEEDTEVYDFINYMLQNMDTDINTLAKQMTAAIMWGFNVHEKIYTLNNDNQVIIKDAIPVHIKTLQNEPFQFDSNGDLKCIHQVSQLEEVDIPIDKVLLYSFGSMYDEKEGHGLLYDFLPIVEDKENIMDWLMTFAERNGSPTMYGKTDNVNSRNEMLKAFDDLADGTTGLVVETEDDVGVLESSHRGEIFFNALQYNDNKIFRRMYIGNLLMGDNSQTGTYAQSQTQLEFGNMVFDGILEEYAKVFQHQLINPIVEINFGSERKAPKISFDKFTSGDMQKLFSIIQPLMQMGVVDGENSAVHEALALLFKVEAGVEYVNDEPDMTGLDEEFDLPPEPEPATSTQDILDNILDGGIDGGNLTDDILNEVT